MRSKSDFGRRPKPRILSLVLSALIFVPNNPFVASAAAQVFDAAVGAARVGAAIAVGASAAPENIRVVAPANLEAASAQPVVVLEKVNLPSKQRTTQMLGGTPAEAAAALVEKLQFEVRAL